MNICIFTVAVVVQILWIGKRQKVLNGLIDKRLLVWVSD